MKKFFKLKLSTFNPLDLFLIGSLNNLTLNCVFSNNNNTQHLKQFIQNNLAISCIQISPGYFYSENKLLFCRQNNFVGDKNLLISKINLEIKKNFLTLNLWYNFTGITKNYCTAKLYTYKRIPLQKKNNIYFNLFLANFFFFKKYYVISKVNFKNFQNVPRFRLFFFETLHFIYEYGVTFKPQFLEKKSYLFLEPLTFGSNFWWGFLQNTEISYPYTLLVSGVVKFFFFKDMSWVGAGNEQQISSITWNKFSNAKIINNKINLFFIILVLCEKLNLQVFFFTTKQFKLNPLKHTNFKYNDFFFNPEELYSSRQSFDSELTEQYYNSRASSTYAYQTWFVTKLEPFRFLFAKFSVFSEVTEIGARLPMKSISQRIFLLFIGAQLLNDLIVLLSSKVFFTYYLKQKEPLNLFMYNNNYRPELLFYFLIKKSFSVILKTFFKNKLYTNFFLSIDRNFLPQFLIRFLKKTRIKFQFYSFIYDPSSFSKINYFYKTLQIFLKYNLILKKLKYFTLPLFFYLLLVCLVSLIALALIHLPNFWLFVVGTVFFAFLLYFSTKLKTNSVLQKISQFSRATFYSYFLEKNNLILLQHILSLVTRQLRSFLILKVILNFFSKILLWPNLVNHKLKNLIPVFVVFSLWQYIKLFVNFKYNKNNFKYNKIRLKTLGVFIWPFYLNNFFFYSHIKQSLFRQFTVYFMFNDSKTLFWFYQELFANFYGQFAWWVKINPNPIVVSFFDYNALFYLRTTAFYLNLLGWKNNVIRSYYASPFKLRIRPKLVLIVVLNLALAWKRGFYSLKDGVNFLNKTKSFDFRYYSDLINFDYAFHKFTPLFLPKISYKNFTNFNKQQLVSYIQRNFSLKLIFFFFALLIPLIVFILFYCVAFFISRLIIILSFIFLKIPLRILNLLL